MTASRLARGVRLTWRYGRWGLVAFLLPIVIAIQIAVVTLIVAPYDPDDLTATAEPLVLLDVRGEQIAVLPAIGADRTRWTKLGELPALAVSAVIESEDQGFWDHGGVSGAGIARAVWLDLQGGRFGGSGRKGIAEPVLQIGMCLLRVRTCQDHQTQV